MRTTPSLKNPRILLPLVPHVAAVLHAEEGESVTLIHHLACTAWRSMGPYEVRQLWFFCPFFRALLTPLKKYP